MKTNLNRILTLFLVMVASLSYAQERTISGTITDENGLPLPSATIVVKGTSKTSSTSWFCAARLQRYGRGGISWRVQWGMWSLGKIIITK